MLAAYRYLNKSNTEIYEAVYTSLVWIDRFWIVFKISPPFSCEITFAICSKRPLTTSKERIPDWACFISRCSTTIAKDTKPARKNWLPKIGARIHIDRFALRWPSKYKIVRVNIKDLFHDIANSSLICAENYQQNWSDLTPWTSMTLLVSLPLRHQRTKCRRLGRFRKNSLIERSYCYYCQSIHHHCERFKAGKNWLLKRFAYTFISRLATRLFFYRKHSNTVHNNGPVKCLRLNSLTAK